jgi:hypothetical protein
MVVSFPGKAGIIVRNRVRGKRCKILQKRADCKFTSTKHAEHTSQRSVENRRLESASRTRECMSGAPSAKNVQDTKGINYDFAMLGRQLLEHAKYNFYE